MKATLNFTNYDSAKAFARAWAFKTSRGYTLSSKREDGGTELILDGVTESDAEWINSQVEKIKVSEQ